MATRLVSPRGQSPGYSSSPIDQAHAQTQTHTQTQAQAQAQAEVAFVGHHIYPPLHPLPPSLPGISSTPSRARQRRSSTITTAATTTATSTTTRTTTTAASTDTLPNVSTLLRHRPTSTAPPPRFWHAQPVNLWPADDHELLPFNTSQPGNALVDDPYLAAFAEADFSSPSSYPSFIEPDAHLSQSHAQTRPPPVPPPSRPQPSAPCPSATTAPRDPSGACILNPDCAAPQRSTTQLSSSTTTAGESQSTWPTLGSFDFDDSGLFDSPASSFSDNMPQARRRPPPAAPPHDAVHANKRRRTSTNASNQTPTKSPSSRRKHQPLTTKDVDDSLFESNDSPPNTGVDAPSSEFTTIDLTEATEVPEDLRKPVEDNRIKLVAFQCVICMDDVTTLTVTHCGHLYCAQCLHSSLHVEATKGKCPMCRQKLDMRPRESYSNKTKGFWPLELKLMTATRKGKRKADSQL
ncbi:hypothetical protein QQX98_005573 [Neonectria punicea]|uniref:RING-type domain-containing protein n=1 Tax=Neonectria punicea TaxID=979145 RepID=A0ABR1H444_9HYPO